MTRDVTAPVVMRTISLKVMGLKVSGRSMRVSAEGHTQGNGQSPGVLPTGGVRLAFGFHGRGGCNCRNGCGMRLMGSIRVGSGRRLGSGKRLVRVIHAARRA
jgi:hypothetical protein